MKAILLAGADNCGSLQKYSQVPKEALIPINGKPMINYILEVLCTVDEINQVIVVGLEVDDNLFKDNKCKYYPGGTTLWENLHEALEKVKDEPEVLVVTADIPLITKKSVLELFRLYRCDGEFEVWYPLVSKEVTDLSFPGTSRTYVKLKDGTFTGGNLFIIKPQRFLVREKEITEVYALRKSPLKLARRLGWEFLFKVITRKLTLAQAENKVEEVFGIKGKALVFNYPEIAVDIDKPSDYEMVEKMLTS